MCRSQEGLGSTFRLIFPTLPEHSEDRHLETVEPEHRNQ